jgi:hypothetical protein
LNGHYPGIYSYITACRENIKDGKGRIFGPVERLLFIGMVLLLLVGILAAFTIRRSS